jgi:AraC family transcriptional regulator, melibiose operon regulatory protein
MPLPKTQPVLYTRAGTETQEALGLKAWDAHPAHMPLSHRHNDLELNLVEQGSATYLFGGQRIVLNAGTLVLFWAVSPHQLVESEENTYMYWLTLPLAWFLHQKWPDTFRQSVLNCELVYDMQMQEHDRHLFMQWQQDLQDDSAENREIVLLEVEARLKRMAARQGGPAQASKPSPTHKQTQAEKMAAFLAENYQNTISVESAARVVGLHPNYAMNVFRKAYGQTIVEYLTQYRIAQAQQMLVTTDQTVLDIAMQTGFGSASQFYTAFKRLCGLSPRAYRESLR